MKKSLQLKTGALVVLIAIVLSTVSVTVSYNVYKNTMESRYRETTANLAQTEAVVLDTKALSAITDAVMGIYRGKVAANGGPIDFESMSKAELDTYLSAFSSISSMPEYEIIAKQLHEIGEANDTESNYVAYMDAETLRGIYIIDSSDDPCLPGTADVMEASNLERIKSGDYNFPAYITNYPEYGWLCTAAAGVFDESGKIIANAYVDISMNDVVANRLAFLRRLSIALILITIISSLAFILLVNKIIVKPINSLAKATAGFVEKEYEAGTEDNSTDLAIQSEDEIGQLYRSFSKMKSDIHTYINDLTRVTAEKERISAELNVATQIQADMLPRIFPAFPERKEFDIYASMTPAKEVGGDFYDYFFVDDDHIALVIADVSGKGVPAALFMVIAKTLIKNIAQNTGSYSPSDILYVVNNQLCDGNEAELFVTVWLAIIELSTGKGYAANAGHEHPTLCKSGEKYELLKYRHSMAVAAMDGVPFSEHEFKLNPGDKVFVYTDGVAEATNKDDELYGTDRMMDALNKNPSAEPEELLHNVKESLQEFVGDAPQFDDVTMLCFKYNGPDGEEKEETL